jgi:hypothetical protein
MAPTCSWNSLPHWKWWLTLILHMTDVHASKGHDMMMIQIKARAWKPRLPKRPRLKGKIFCNVPNHQPVYHGGWCDFLKTCNKQPYVARWLCHLFWPMWCLNHLCRKDEHIWTYQEITRLHQKWQDRLKHVKRVGLTIFWMMMHHDRADRHGPIQIYSNTSMKFDEHTRIFTWQSHGNHMAFSKSNHLAITLPFSIPKLALPSFGVADSAEWTGQSWRVPGCPPKNRRS